MSRATETTLSESLRILVLSALLAMTLPPTASAQSTSVRAYLTPASAVGVGQQFVLNVEITGTQSLDRQPQLPDLTSFAQFLGSNTQSSMQVVNGQTTVSLTVQYRYQALIEGSFVIPAFEVRAGGGVRVTEPISVTVSVAPPAPVRSPDGEVGPDDLFITAEASKSTLHDGEPFIVEYRIWTRLDVTSFGMTHLPELEGFWVEDVTPEGQPQVEQLTRDGQQYASAVIRRVAVVPTGVGERTLEPIGVEAQVRVRRGRDPFDSFFGRNSLLGATTVPTTVLSNRLTVDVEPLPPGRPEPFSGVVGSLRLSSDLDRDSVDANEAVTLTVRVTAQGNVRGVSAPDIDFPPDFEVFPPEVSESVSGTATGLSGTKTFEYVLIPRAPGRREIPSVAMSYFDAEAGTYRTVESGSLPLTVAGTIIEGPAALARSGVDQFRRDIRFIHLGTLDLRPTGRPLFEGMGFWIFALLPLAGIAGAVAVRRHWDLMEGDVAYARGRSARRVAKKRLAEARRLAGEANARPFFTEVARALRGLVADRLNLAEAGLQIADLRRSLSTHGVDDPTIAELQDCLEYCDRQRFAPPGSDPEEKTRFLERAGLLMAALDRSIRR